ncbi:Lnt Apolipoprotein N-acyltransferase [Burkholderiaceae bacterium]
MNTLWLKGRLALGLLAGGALQALSFAPDPLPQWALSPLQLCTMAWLVTCIWRAPNGLFAARRAWLFALGHFVVGLYWLTISMYVYGYMPMPLAIVALVALSAYLALFASLAAWLVHQIKAVSQSSLSATLWSSFAWASAWTISEWLRATLFTGFPWLNIGYAHVDSWFAGWSSILGLYGVTFVTAFSAAAIAALVGLRPRTQVQTHRDTATRATTALHGVVGLLALAFAFIGLALGHIQWSTPAGSPLVVRLIQGNVDQGVKFSPDHLYKIIQQHQRLAATPAPAGSPQPQVVLLPETVMAVFQHQIAPAAWQAWIDVAKAQQSTILIGSALYDTKTGAYTNSVIGIDAATTAQQLVEATMVQRYDKSHLVPFGEFVPFGFRWFVNLMSIPLGDFTRGTSKQKPFAIAGQRIAPNICYEDVFGEELLPAVRGTVGAQDGATILANFSNLAWFGDSWALRQHWQMSRLRAIETSRPMLRTTNTGATGAIDHRGHGIAQLPPNRVGVLDTTIQGQQGLTPYVRIGNGLILGLCVLILFAAWWRGKGHLDRSV